MKHIFYAFIGLIVVMTVMILGIYTLDGVPKPKVSENSTEKHVVVLVQNTKDSFWDAFRSGVITEAEKQNILVEFVEVPPFDSDAAALAIERAVLSKVNAIVLQPINGERTSSVLDYARKSGIHILTFENDAFTMEGVPTVGSNSWLVGSTMAKMAISTLGGAEGRMAILINNKESDDTRYKSLKLQGMLEALAPHDEITISGIHNVDNSLLGVDKLTRDILRKDPTINVILCTDDRGTPAVAQAIVDTGVVGSISIIGFGNMEQTMNYIERGVIQATISSDGAAIGKEVITKTATVLSGMSVSESTSTPIYTYTDDNLDDFRKRFPKGDAPEDSQ